VAHACNPSTQEAEEGGLWVQGQLDYMERPWVQKTKEKTVTLQWYAFQYEKMFTTEIKNKLQDSIFSWIPFCNKKNV
jgi:hypothetical protein